MSLTHIKPVALAAGLPAIGWHSFRHTVSAWSKEAGLELEDVKTLASRGHRHYFESVWGSGDESQATDSATHGRIRQAAGVRGSLKTGNSLAGGPTRYYS